MFWQTSGATVPLKPTKSHICMIRCEVLTRWLRDGVSSTPLAVPFLFSFASQCFTARSDAAYLNNVLFFQELTLLSSCSRLLCFTGVRSSVNCTASFDAAYIQITVILCIAPSDCVMSLAEGRSTHSKFFFISGGKQKIFPLLSQFLHKLSECTKNYIIDEFSWTRERHPYIIHCRWHSSLLLATLGGSPSLLLLLCLHL